MELVWSPAAVDDISAAVDYIESELGSPIAAERFVDSVIEKAQLFADVPGAGLTLRTIDGINTGYHYMLAGNWMLFSNALTERLSWSECSTRKATT